MSCLFTKTFGGGGGGGDKYFFPTNIREKEETPFGPQFKKKNYFINSPRLGKNKTGKQVLPGTVLQNQNTLIKKGTWLSH